MTYWFQQYQWHKYAPKIDLSKGKIGTNRNWHDIPNRRYLASAEIVQPIWKNWNYVIPLLYSKSGKQMENYCKYVRYHVDLQLKFTVPSLLIKLVHNCYLNSLFFTALLKTWERNEKGTENMSDMPRSAPFTMQFFKKNPPDPWKSLGHFAPSISTRCARQWHFQVFLQKPVGRTDQLLTFNFG